MKLLIKKGKIFPKVKRFFNWIEKKIISILPYRLQKNIDMNLSDVKFLALVAFFVIISALNVLAAPAVYYEEKPDTKGVSFDTDHSETYWLEFLTKNPSYIDGWIELAKVYYVKGDFVGAKAALNQASQIDPNSERLIQAELLLGFR